MTVRSGEVASAIGKGVVSGVVGTAVLTAAQRIEMALSGREGSSAPAEAVEQVLKDAGFHALYAVAVGLAYAYLEAHERE